MLVRLALLYSGLTLFGLGIGLLVVADLGLPPWDVFHTGVAESLDWPLGRVIVVTSFVVLLAWVPLRERPGLGTISNAILVGVFVDVFGHVLPDEPPSALAVRVALVAVGIVINGVATGMYIGARFGPGPRDGLMTALAAGSSSDGDLPTQAQSDTAGPARPARRRWSVRTVRTAIEVAVLIAGVSLGGSIGVATVAFALAIGPIAHHSIPYFTALTSARSVRPPVAVGIAVGD